MFCADSQLSSQGDLDALSGGMQRISCRVGAQHRRRIRMQFEAATCDQGVITEALSIICRRRHVSSRSAGKHSSHPHF